MEEINVNAEFLKSNKTSKNHTGPRSSKKSFSLDVIVFLGLLSVFQLIGLITLGVYYHDSAADRSDMRNKLSSMTEDRDLLNANLSTMSEKISFMKEERDLLHANLTEKTKELESLQHLSKQKKTCPPGWRMFQCSCYFLSEISDTWDAARNDCISKGADLVVINSAEEQKFLTELTGKETWIGFTDKEEEGMWKWIDGTPVNLTYWVTPQPDNGGGDPKYGEEDCGESKNRYLAWNDLSCEDLLHWICEI